MDTPGGMRPSSSGKMHPSDSTPWGQVRVKVLSPNPQLLRLGQLLAKPRGVVPNKYTKAFKLSTRK
jgi:hypothetical protein